MSADSKRFLGREEILALPDLETREVYVPEWGTWVRVRALTGVERDEFEAASLKGKGSNREVNLVNLRARLVAASVVNEKGERLFSDADVVALGRKSARALDRVFRLAQRLSGLTDEDVEELAAELKNGRGAGSSSSSHGTWG